MLVSILLICLATFANGKLCPHNQYFSSILEKCDTCSRCVSPDIVIRPCQENADTVCGPLSELNIDWTWLKNQGSHHSANHNSKRDRFEKKMLDTFKENFDEIRQHEEHMKEKQRYLKHMHDRDESEEMESDEIESGDIFVGDRYRLKKGPKEKRLWEKLKLLNSQKTREPFSPKEKHPGRGSWRAQNHIDDDLEKNSKTWQKLLRGRSDGLHFDDKEALNLLKSSRKTFRERIEKEENETGYDPNHLKFDENGILIKNFEFTKVEDNVKMEKLVDDSNLSDDFSTTEKFILDWQTVILGMAVSSCIVFFLVAAIYSVQHAKHWKKLINYFDTDVDELQSWISSKNSERKIPLSGIYKTTTEVVHNEGSQCKYLERIIRMNGKNRFNFTRGNVYEKDNKRPCELKPLTKKYPIVHKKGNGSRV